MKKMIIGITVLVGMIFLSGCGQSEPSKPSNKYYTSKLGEPLDKYSLDREVSSYGYDDLKDCIKEKTTLNEQALRKYEADMKAYRENPGTENSVSNYIYGGMAKPKDRIKYECYLMTYQKAKKLYGREQEAAAIILEISIEELRGQ